MADDQTSVAEFKQRLEEFQESLFALGTEVYNKANESTVGSTKSSSEEKLTPEESDNPFQPENSAVAVADLTTNSTTNTDAQAEPLFNFTGESEPQVDYETIE